VNGFGPGKFFMTGIEPITADCIASLATGFMPPELLLLLERIEGAGPLLLLFEGAGPELFEFPCANADDDVAMIRVAAARSEYGLIIPSLVADVGLFHRP
jgi:hypothetical protein